MNRFNSNNLLLLLSHLVVSSCGPVDSSTPGFPVLHLPCRVQGVKWDNIRVTVCLSLLGTVSVYTCCLFTTNQFSSVAQSCLTLWLTPWTAARLASLSITNSRSLLKLMSIESAMPSNCLILCRPLLLPSIFPSIRVFPVSQFFTSGGQSIGVSASASALPMNIRDWFPLGWTGLISLQFKELSRVFFNTTV